MLFPFKVTGVSDCLQFRTAIIVGVFKFACIVPKGGRMSSLGFVTTLFIDRQKLAMSIKLPPNCVIYCFKAAPASDSNIKYIIFCLQLKVEYPVNMQRNSIDLTTIWNLLGAINVKMEYNNR